MKIQQYITCCLLFVMASAIAQKKLAKQEFLLNGTISGKADGTVYVRYMGVHGKFVIDSCHLQQGHFSLTGFIKEPTITFISTLKRAIPDDDDMEADGKNSTLFFLEPGTITANFEVGRFKDGQFSGSASQDQFAELNHQTAQLSGKEKADALHRFLDQHPHSYVTAYLVSGSHFDLDSLRLYYNRLPKAVKKSAYGEDISEKIEKKEKVAIGHSAPDFKQQTADGKEISIKDFRGKYVLLTFWNATNSASRTANQKLVSVYNQFKDKNFTILGASTDGQATRKIWRAALQKDALPWMQLLALKSNHNPAATAYDIESLPANFLIDPKGKIIGVNLKPEALSQKLASLINK